MKRLGEKNVGGISKKSKKTSDEQTSIVDFGESTSMSSKGKSVYETYFEMTYMDGIKYGNCIDCGKNAVGKLKVSYKMGDHNTSSLRDHLKSKHPDNFKKLLEAQGLIDRQNTEKKDVRNLKLEDFFQVNIIKLFY